MKQKEPFTVITDSDIILIKHALNHYLCDEQIINKETIQQGEALLRKLYQVESNILKTESGKLFIQNQFSYCR